MIVGLNYCYRGWSLANEAINLVGPGDIQVCRSCHINGEQRHVYKHI